MDELYLAKNKLNIEKRKKKKKRDSKKKRDNNTLNECYYNIFEYRVINT